MFDSTKRDETSGEAAEFDEGAWCTGCDGRLIFLGRKDFHEEPSYAKTYSVVEALYGSPRLNLPFDGVLLIGY